MTPGHITTTATVLCAHGDRLRNVQAPVGTAEAVVVKALTAAGWREGPKGWLCPMHNAPDALVVDLRALATYVVRGLSVTIAPADTYVRNTLSAGEVLSACLGRAIPEDDHDWAKDDLAYAETLLHALEEFFKTCEVKE